MFWLSGGTFRSSSAAGPFNERTSETALSFSLQLFAHAAASVSYTHLDVYKRQLCLVQQIIRQVTNIKIYDGYHHRHRNNHYHYLPSSIIPMASYTFYPGKIMSHTLQKDPI